MVQSQFLFILEKIRVCVFLSYWSLERRILWTKMNHPLPSSSLRLGPLTYFDLERKHAAELRAKIRTDWPPMTRREFHTVRGKSYVRNAVCCYLLLMWLLMVMYAWFGLIWLSLLFIFWATFAWSKAFFVPQLFHHVLMKRYEEWIRMLPQQNLDIIFSFTFLLPLLVQFIFIGLFWYYNEVWD